MRLVSLTCSNTEIVSSLGYAAHLVGVDDHSDYPADVVARLPRVGPDLTIDPEKVAALEPDLVLASLTVPGHEHVVASLKARGLPLLVTEPISVEDVYADVRLIAECLLEFPDGIEALERAERVIADMRRELAPVLEPTRRPKILVEWWPRPVIVPGRDSWVNQLLEVAGAQNPFASRDVRSTPIEHQEALLEPPDAVVIAWCGVHVDKYRPSKVYERAAWQDTPALKERRVYRVPEAFLGRPSPRLVCGAAAFRSIAADVLEGRSAPPDALPRGIDVTDV
ncbi:MAG: ABC transporter substrate-binding protein [Myxococcales bacterium]|nr:ABC transporter substrate-binding protein [Myxococcales bacterium]